MEYSGSQEFKQLFEAAEVIAIVSHRKPDGDTLGANLALAFLAEDRGKHAISYCADPVETDRTLMPRLDRFTRDPEAFQKFPIDLVICVDAGDLERLGLKEIVGQWNNPRALRIVNVDHHGLNDFFGEINIVDDHAASTTSMLYQIFRAWKVRITPDIATALLWGILYDTGSFSNLATTSEAMQASAELLGFGGRMKDVIAHTFQHRSVKTLKLWGHAFAKLKQDPTTGVVTTAITQQDLKACDATEDDVSGVSNFLNSLDNAKAVIVYVQENGTVRGSLRSRGDEIDVSAIAKQYGGGGHKKAAGFSCKGSLQEAPEGWIFVPA